MEYDIKITNALIIDGTGKKSFSGEVGIKNRRITKVDDIVTGAAKIEIDAEQHVLSPGFIDLHNHSHPGIIMNFLTQGVTTVVGGNCGFNYGRIDGTIFPPVENWHTEKKSVLGPNFAMLAGHNTIRMNVMGRVNRAPSQNELEKMQKMLKKEMGNGCFGFSTGLAYVPGAYSKTDELLKLTKILKDTGGFHASHIRNESDEIIGSIKEIMDIGDKSGVPVHISHHKICGMNNWGKSRETIALIKKGRKSGMDITLDQYPYTASCGTIHLLLPSWVGEGSPVDIKKRVERERSKILEILIENFDSVYGGNLSRIIFAACSPMPFLAGKTLAEASKTLKGKSSMPEAAETVLDIVSADSSHGSTMAIYHRLSEDDVEYIMKYPETAVASDGWAAQMNSGHPHPRLYGTFPRVLGRYAREKGTISLEDAVKKMTGIPAKRLGLKDRGVISQNAWADIVIWDKDKIKDNSTFKKPHQYSTGIDYVIVNGSLVLQKGQAVENYSGVLLLRE